MHCSSSHKGFIMNSEGFPYADIVILALIAGFVLLRLRNVLGNKTGNDSPNFFNRITPVAGEQDPVVQLDEKSLKPKLLPEADPYLTGMGNNAIAETLNGIKAKDPAFNATAFLQGARSAFEMVFDAFVKGDKPTLKMLMSDTIYQHFIKELDARDGQESKPETTLVSAKAQEITEAELIKNSARIGVRFISEQVSVLRDAKGTIVEGDPSELHHVEDHWTFERDVTSKNPNWKIIET